MMAGKQTKFKDRLQNKPINNKYTSIAFEEYVLSVMGWRTLKAGFLVVMDAEESEKVQPGKLAAQWVSLLYDYNTKWMKLEVRECRTLQPPQMSLVLKANLVNITFASHDPTFVVCVESKRVGNVTLSFSPDTSLSEVLEWQTLFRSAISPNVTYAVTMIQDTTELPAILCVTERSVQLSIAERSTPERSTPERATAGTITDRKGSTVISSRDTLLTTDSTVISTDVDSIKLTVEDTLMLTLNHQSVILRTNRLVELYHRLLSYFTDRRAGVSDYVNTRRDSRCRLLEEDEANNLHIPRNTHDTSPSSRRKSQTPHSIPSPDLPSSDSAHLSLTKLPKLAPLAKIRPLSKPEPPPKPKNAKEILSQFEFESTSSSHNSGEPIYKSVRKPKSTISASSIGIRGLSESSDKPDDIPALPGSPPEYATVNHLLKETTSRRLSGISSDVDYVNTRISKPKSDLRSPVAEEEDDDMYESLYSLRGYPDPLANLPPPRGYSDPLANLPPPRETWLYQPTSTLDHFPRFDMNKQQRVQSKMLFNKIQLFDKKILRKINSKT